MSKYLNHNELIGSYLEGGMSPDQMLEFENQLHTDPLLRSEFELQQDIVNSLKDFRKSQLKARLDQVPVSMSPTVLVGVKTAAAIVLTGIIGLGSYLYFYTGDVPVEESLTTQEITIDESLEQTTTANEIQELPVERKSKEITEEQIDESSTAIKEADMIKTQPLAKTEASKEVVEEEVVEEIASPVVNSPNIIDPSIDETVQEETLEMPSAALAQEELSDNPVIEVETAKKDAELFHYRYYSGKLYLYGDFRDIPYEILELNSANGKILYMFYDQKYYQILDDQVELTPLQPLEDAEIIRRLEIIKENK